VRSCAEKLISQAAIERAYALEIAQELPWVTENGHVQKIGADQA
jgi:hypothetical protein